MPVPVRYLLEIIAIPSLVKNRDEVCELVFKHEVSRTLVQRPPFPEFLDSVLIICPELVDKIVFAKSTSPTSKFPKTLFIISRAPLPTHLTLSKLSSPMSPLTATSIRVGNLSISGSASTAP